LFLAYHHGGFTISLLILSDHKANQELLASMLRRQGYTYEIVENGQDAVHITAIKEYDLILMVIIASKLKIGKLFFVFSSPKSHLTKYNFCY
jgi:PleD family two-component response regulator